MTHTISLVAVATAMLCLTLAGPARAGLDVKTRTTGSGTEPDSSRMRTEGDLLRIDTAAPPSGQGATSMIFDADAQVLRVLRHGDRTYVEIDEAFAERLSSKVAEAQKMMEAQLAKMPPEQRAMMEKMMQGGALPFPKPGAKKDRPPLEARATGEADTVDGTPCSLFRLRRGAEEKGDVCVASWSAVGASPEDIAVLKKLGAFQAKMTKSFAGSMPGAEQPFELLERVDGFPLRTRRVAGGAVESETFFEDVTKTDVPADVFEIPAGYTRKDIALPNDG